MKTNETLKLLDDKDFLDKIYYFSYHRCNTSFEAEDLCSDIVLAIISAIHKQERIENFYAFVWTIARRVYADYCEKRNAERQVSSIENSDLMSGSKENEIEEFVEETAEQEQISRICRVCIRQYPKNTQKSALQGGNKSTDRRVRTLFLYMPLKLQSAHWFFLKIFCRMKAPKSTGGFCDEKYL